MNRSKIKKSYEKAESDFSVAIAIIEVLKNSFEGQGLVNEMILIDIAINKFLGVMGEFERIADI